MVDSLLKFTRDFEKLKSMVRRKVNPEDQIALLIKFWPNINETTSKIIYKAFHDEFTSLLLNGLDLCSLNNLLIEELISLISILSNLLNKYPEIEKKLKKCAYILAQKYFYVGELSKGLDSCQHLIKHNYNVDTDFIDSAQTEIERFREICNKTGNHNSELHRLLTEMLVEWEGLKESVNREQVHCLFVEQNDNNSPDRGYLKALHGSVEIFDKSAETDEITFDNISVKPDDKFIGVAYNALKAVRNKLKYSGYSDIGGKNYHAHYHLENSGQQFIGDSIGLSIAIYSYVQLLKTEISRQDKYLSAEVAFTGSIDKSGNILAVNNDSLSAKIERVFFSPIKYLVIPRDNLDRANLCLGSLKAEYPNRHLQIIAVDNFSELTENHNIIRSEKVCLGEYVIKKTYSYSRMAKFQIPLLILLSMLAYFLFCQIVPKAWVWFDRNPQFVELSETGFKVFNNDSKYLWKIDYNCGEIDEESKYLIYDLDNDSKNEVIFLLDIPRNEVCDDDVRLFTYNEKGELIFSRDCKSGGKLRDTIYSKLNFAIATIEAIPTRSNTILMTYVYKSGYGAHFKFWDKNGTLLGWYINSGHSGMYGKNFTVINDSTFVFLGYNNSLGKGCLFGLNPNNIQGYSPPHNTLFPDHLKGNEVFYIAFPKSYMRSITLTDYSQPQGIQRDSAGSITVLLREDQYSGACLYYHLDSNFHVYKMSSDDTFRNHFRSQRNKGLTLINNLSALYDILLDSVLYYTDSGFVTEGELRALENK